MKQFDYSVNGLRAVAVLIVIAFHFGFPVVSGGFVGVDIFFVISGYVITLGTLQKFREGRFSTLEYFKRRFYRIFPALAVTSLIITLISAFILFPTDLLRSAKHALASIGFVSNFVFWKEVGYFDVNSDYKPFLHTWSLAVEWQFYLLWPVVVYMLYKVKRYAIPLMMASILSGIALSALLVDRSNFVFYMMPLRGWEFAIGGFIALLPTTSPIRLKAPILALFIGLSAIISSAIFYTPKTTFPGIAAVLPCFGTFLILFFNRKYSDPLFKTPVMQYLGTISYSLYLVHWPVHVLYKQFIFREMNGLDVMAMCFITLVLSHLSYTLVEQPFRSPSLSLKPIRKFALLLIVILTGGLVTYIFHTDGMTNRFNQNENELIDYFRIAHEEYREKFSLFFPKNENEEWNKKDHADIPCLYDEYQLKSPNDPRIIQCVINNFQNNKTALSHVLLIGDSNGKNIYEALKRAFPEIQFSMLMHSGCAPAESKNCFPHLKEQLGYLLEYTSVDGIVLSSRYSNQSIESLESTVSFIRNQKKPFLIIGATPTLLRMPDMVMIHAGGTLQDNEFRLSLNKSYYHDDIFENDENLIDIANEYQGYFYNKKSVLCPDNKCFIKSSNFKNPIFLDSHHLSEDGEQLLIQSFKIDANIQTFVSRL